MDTMPTEPKRIRQERSPELKAQVLAECDWPGASVAQVALAHGVNANLVHGWRKLERERRQAAGQALEAAGVASAPPTEAATFVPVTVEQRVAKAMIEIEIEFCRGR